MQDFTLIKRCQKGDKSAFQELIIKYHKPLYDYLLKLTKNKQNAEDITQETFIKIIRNIEKFDIYKKASFLTYMIAISKNLYIDYIRKESKINKVSIYDFDVEDEAIDVENTIIDKMTFEFILDEMQNLKDEQKMAIRMKYIEGLTLKEISRRFNAEPKTIKSRIHNGVLKIRKSIERRKK